MLNDPIQDSISQAVYIIVSKFQEIDGKHSVVGADINLNWSLYEDIFIDTKILSHFFMSIPKYEDNKLE